MRAILVLTTLIGAVVTPAAAGVDPPKAPVERKRAEAHAARREHVELLLRQAPTGECDLVAAAAAVRRLADEAAAAGDSAAAIQWHERWAKAVQEYVAKLTGPGPKHGNVKSLLLQASEARIGAEIDLCRRRGSVPAELVKLLKERVVLRTETEELYEKALKAGVGSKVDYLECKVARLDAEAELAAAEATARKGGK